MDTQISLWLSEVRARVQLLPTLTPGSEEYLDLVEDLAADTSTLAGAAETVINETLSTNTTDPRMISVIDNVRDVVTTAIMNSPTSPARTYTKPVAEAVGALVNDVETHLASANQVQRDAFFYSKPSARLEAMNYIRSRAGHYARLVIEAMLKPSFEGAPDPMADLLVNVIPTLTREEAQAASAEVYRWFMDLPVEETEPATDPEPEPTPIEPAPIVDPVIVREEPTDGTRTR